MGMGVLARRVVVALAAGLIGAACGQSSKITIAPGDGGGGGSDGQAGNGDGSFFGGDASTGEGGNNGCIPRTCSQLNPPVGCGSAGDGCGGVIQCGSCTPPQTCGGGDPDAGKPSVPSQCGGSMGCVPKTCAAYPPGSCGQQPDGCGGVTPDCSPCAAPAVCSGDPTMPGLCGTPMVACTPKTCASYPGVCGPQSDGCNGLTANCNACTAPQTCGGGAMPDTCGSAPPPDSGTDAGNPCVPKTCASYPNVCGVQSDGCGGLTVNCNACAPPLSCGGGGTPDQCGMTACVPKTCAAFPGVCGQQADGCGGLTTNCNPCTAPQSCGGGGTAGVCGSGGGGMCTPQTCAQTCAAAGVPLAQCCGVFADGCGGMTAGCGACLPPSICGGGGVASACGDSNLDGGDAASACTGLCGQIPTCGATTTTVTGRVYAPTDPTMGYGAPDPIQHAHVFIPNDPATLTAFATTVACACDTASGPAIATTYSAIDGTFTLTNVPAGNNIPIVIQLGRWRRVFYTNILPCVPNSITNDVTCRAGTGCNTRLPRHEHEFNAFDNIPLIAEVTGSADPIECVLPKIGIDTTAYSNGGGTGRVQFYKANGATFSGATPAENTLWSAASTLEGFDMVIFDCEGSENTETAAALANVQAYANAGGRVFASHYSYVWTFTNDPWGCGGEANNGNPTPKTATCTTAGHTVADWYADQPVPNNDPITAIIDDPTMLSWLSQPLINVVTAGTIQLGAPRHDTTGVIAPNAMGVPATQLYAHADPSQSANTPLEFTWNTPPFAPSAQQCGRVLFSDFHVNTGGSGTGRFPGECGGASPMTPQEKVLEYMLFDLGDCIPTINPPPPPTCTPKTCASYPNTCGAQSDGCGGVTANCGVCTAPQVCGVAGPGKCGTPCTPKTCASYPASACGQQSDGCGGLTANCGTCMSSCTPQTCANYPAGTCGQQADGCGGLTASCGMCTPPQTCGGGGSPGVCGAPDAGSSCIPACPSGVQCGPAGDGCGGVIQCGTCAAPQVCGGGGPGKCGPPPGCTAKTCASYPPGMCGQQSDGCGGLTPDCGPCTPPQTCGGSGMPGVCGQPSCTPETCGQTCAAAGVTQCCGQFSDGCGGLTAVCGACVAPASCGGGGVANQCGGGVQ